MKIFFIFFSLFLIPLIPNSSAEQNLYVYVDELPSWAPHASNVMYDATKYWEKQIPGLNFYQVDDPNDANFRVQWVKEFGVEHVGYAYGNQFIEVGLGDSNCNGTWQPYSSNYVAQIMMHEIGHVLGFEHSNDETNIMYPVALNTEYGIVEHNLPFTENYSYFVPICSARDVTSINYEIITDDPTYGFDAYAVPSQESLDNWGKGNPFSYYADDGCFGTNYLQFTGTCEGMSSSGGLLVTTHEKLTNPITTITVRYQESVETEEFDSNSLISLPSDDETTLNISNSYDLYVDPQQRFSIKYPSSWLLDNESVNEYVIGFYDKYDWSSTLSVFYYPEIDYASYDSNKILKEIESYELDFCNSSTFTVDGFTCYDFNLVDSETITLSSGYESYNLVYSTTRQFNTPGYDDEYTIITTVTEIHDGNAAWLILTETDDFAFDSYSENLITAISSFKLLKSATKMPEDPQLTPNPKPIPNPVPKDDPIVVSSPNLGTIMVEHESYTIIPYEEKQVHITGTVDDPSKGDRVTLTITYPDGTTNGNIVFLTKQGNFESIILLDHTSPTGTYEVLASTKSKIIGKLTFDVIKDLDSARKVPDSQSMIGIEPTQKTEKPIASFVDTEKNPWDYIDRYNNEPDYRDWFDNNYPDYTIYEAVGLYNPLDFVDPTKDPQFYIDRYNNEPEYRNWFDRNYPDYTIYEAVGIPNLPTESSSSNSKIPDWIKNNAEWWSQGQIDDDTFVSGIQFMIKNKIINIPNLPTESSSSNSKIPDWIKNNAEWWSQGLISEDDFVKGIEFLVKEGIVRVD